MWSEFKRQLFGTKTEKPKTDGQRLREETARATERNKAKVKQIKKQFGLK